MKSIIASFFLLFTFLFFIGMTLGLINKDIYATLTCACFVVIGVVGFFITILNNKKEI